MSPRDADPLPVLGLIPAAGRAERLGRLPCSKEILPIGLEPDRQGSLRPKALCSHLLERLQAGGVERALILLRRGKWDIPDYLGGDGGIGLDLIYRVLEPTGSVPETLARAYPFLRDVRVALGFPDILFKPKDAYQRLIARQEETGAELVLGLFPTEQAWKADMVETDTTGRVRRLVIKQASCQLRYTWSIAIWTPAFSRFLYDFVEQNRQGTTDQELYVGDVIQAAIDEGKYVDALPFVDGHSFDAGTPNDLGRIFGQTFDDLLAKPANS